MSEENINIPTVQESNGSSNQKSRDVAGLEETEFINPPVRPYDKSKCNQCLKAFTLTFRRHHCRQCGCAACDSCSRFSAMVEGKKQRVCKYCNFMQNAEVAEEAKVSMEDSEQNDEETMAEDGQGEDLQIKVLDLQFSEGIEKMSLTTPSVIAFHKEVDVGGCVKYKQRMDKLKQYSVTSQSTNAYVLEFVNQLQALQQRILDTEVRVEKADSAYIYTHLSNLKSTQSSLEGREKELMATVGITEIPVDKTPQFHQGDLGNTLLQLHDKICACKEEIRTITQHKHFPEYKHQYRRWHVRQQAEDGSLIGAQTMCIDSIVGKYEIRQGKLGEGCNSLVEFSGVKEGTPFLNITMKDIRMEMSLDKMKLSGTFLGYLFNPDKIDVIVLVHCATVPAYFDGTKWHQHEAGQVVNVEVKKKIKGAASLPDTLINWIVNGIVPREIKKAVEVQLPQLVGNQCDIGSENSHFGLETHGTYEFLGKVNSAILHAPLYSESGAEAQQVLLQRMKKPSQLMDQHALMCRLVHMILEVCQKKKIFNTSSNYGSVDFKTNVSLQSLSAYLRKYGVNFTELAQTNDILDEKMVEMYSKHAKPVYNDVKCLKDKTLNRKYMDLKKDQGGYSNRWVEKEELSWISDDFQDILAIWDHQQFNLTALPEDKVMNQTLDSNSNINNISAVQAGTHNIATEAVQRVHDAIDSIARGKNPDFDGLVGSSAFVREVLSDMRFPASKHSSTACQCGYCDEEFHKKWFSSCMTCVSEISKCEQVCNIEVSSFILNIPLKAAINYGISMFDQQVHMKYMRKKQIEHDNYMRSKHYIMKSHRFSVEQRKERQILAHDVHLQNMMNIQNSFTQTSVKYNTKLRPFAQSVNEVCADLKSMVASGSIGLSLGEGPIVEFRELMKYQDQRKIREETVKQCIDNRLHYMKKLYTHLNTQNTLAYKEELVLRGGSHASRPDVLAQKLKHKLISQNRYNELLRSYHNGGEMTTYDGDNNEIIELDEEDFADCISNDMQLSLRESVQFDLMQEEDRNRMLMYTQLDTGKDVLLQKYVDHIPSDMDVTARHIPPYDGVFRLDGSIVELRQNQSRNNVAHLLNSHTSKDFDFTSNEAVFQWGVNDEEGLSGCFAFIDPWMDLLCYPIVFGSCGIQMNQFPKKSRLGMTDVTLGLESGSLEIPQSALFLADRFVNIYKNYFPGAVLPYGWTQDKSKDVVLQEHYIIDEDDSSLPNDSSENIMHLSDSQIDRNTELVKKFYTELTTPILASEKINPRASVHHLTLLPSCVYTHGPLIFSSQERRIAATTVLQDILQNYLFSPKTHISINLKADINITQIPYVKPEVKNKPAFTQNPEYMEEEVQGNEKSSPNVIKLQNITKYPWLNEIEIDPSTNTSEELYITVCGTSTDQEKIGKISFETSLQDINQDGNIVQALAVIINQEKK